jgi:hypothetical protein
VNYCKISKLFDLGLVDQVLFVDSIIRLLSVTKGAPTTGAPQSGALASAPMGLGGKVRGERRAGVYCVLPFVRGAQVRMPTASENERSFFE